MREPLPADRRPISPSAHAIFTSRREALQLTGESTVERAGAVLAERATTAVVTLAGEGAIAFSGNETTTFAAEKVEHPVDTTGAGDLLAAAYIWAELRGAEPADRLRWAVLYATLAVGVPTGIGGAVREAELVTRRGCCSASRRHRWSAPL